MKKKMGGVLNCGAYGDQGISGAKDGAKCNLQRNAFF